MGMRNFRAMAKEPVTFDEIDRKTLKRAWRVAQEFRLLILVYLSLLLLVALVGSRTPLVLKNVINLAIPRRSVSLLLVYTAEIALLTFGGSAIGILNRYLNSVIGEGIIFRLRTRLFEHLQQLSLSFFTNSQTGAILSRLNSDVVSSQQVVGTLGSVVSDLATLVFTLFFMLQLSVPVTGLALLVVPAILLIDRLLGKRLSRYARAQMQTNAVMAAFEQERFNVSGSLLVSLFGDRAVESTEFSSKAAAVRDAGIRFALFGRLYFTSLSLLGGVGTVAVYAIGGDQAIRGSLSIGALVALAAYITQLFAPLTDLSTARVNLLQALVSFDRVFEVLDVEPDVRAPSDPILLVRPVGAIAFEGVYFRYTSGAPLASLAKEGSAPSAPERDWALEGIDLRIEPGQTVALVGPSGAGKTTITTLMTRLYDPERGRILFDGVDLRLLDLDALRRSIGVVTQDPFLFHDTVRANLLYARPAATESQLQGAIEASQLAEMVDRLPQGIDTVVGERGYRLSGGEKQRLSIARVLIKDPKVVILDEATSSLDATNEALIQMAISETLTARTSVVIAHRLSTILGADTIVVMNHGQVVEVGSHQELLELGGLYAELFHNQFVEVSGGEV